MGELYKDYVVVSVKMPIDLKKKIDRLAAADSKTRNAWILKKLTLGARWGEYEGRK